MQLIFFFRLACSHGHVETRKAKFKLKDVLEDICIHSKEFVEIEMADNEHFEGQELLKFLEEEMEQLFVKD